MNDNLLKVKNILFVALPYISSELHIGRIVGSFYSAKLFKNYKSKIENINFDIISGFDCNGQSAIIRYKELKLDISYDEFINDNKNKIINNLKLLNIDCSILIDTSSKIHSKMTNSFYNNKDICKYLFIKEYNNFYCNYCNKNIEDREFYFICKNKHKINQDNLCDICKEIYDIWGEYKDVYCKMCNNKIIKKKNKGVFIKKDLFIDNKLNSNIYIKNNYLNTLESLDDKLLSREYKGVKISNRLLKKLNYKNDKKLYYYVWFEALIGYYTGLYILYYKDKKVNIKKITKEIFNKKNNIFFIMGKDNTFWHYNIFGELLRKINKDVSFNIINNCFLNNNNKKMSSSDNNIFILEDLIDTYKDICFIKFLLFTLIPSKKDKNITKEYIDEKLLNYNELKNKLEIINSYFIDDKGYDSKEDDSCLEYMNIIKNLWLDFNFPNSLTYIFKLINRILFIINSDKNNICILYKYIKFINRIFECIFE